MSFIDNARQSNFIKHLEKQENAARFLGYYLDRLSAIAEASPAQKSLTLIARSPASPMARAVLAALPEAEALGVRADVVFSRSEPAELMAAWFEAAGRHPSDPLLRLRRANVAALADAHEQVTLGTTFSWVGDSMRRDPETRDAFETFEPFNGEAARRVGRTFAAFWSRSVVMASTHRLAANLSSDDLPAAVLGLTPNAPVSSINTRH